MTVQQGDRIPLWEDVTIDVMMRVYQDMLYYWYPSYEVSMFEGVIGMYHPQLGDPVDLLDTPSMIVDIPLMEQNIARLMGYFRKRNVRVRPHLKTVKSPELAHILLAAGATGCCVAKVSEAEIMAQAGVEDLLITSTAGLLNNALSLSQFHLSLSTEATQRARVDLYVVMYLQVSWKRSKISREANV